jgi:toxin ParE1/3/4
MGEQKLDLGIRRVAKADLANIVDYLAFPAAERFVEAVKHDFELLRQFPGAGGIRKHPSASLRGLRSWPVKGFRKYLIFYVPRERAIEIIRILHGAQDVDRILMNEPAEESK